MAISKLNFHFENGDKIWGDTLNMIVGTINNTIESINAVCDVIADVEPPTFIFDDSGNTLTMSGGPSDVIYYTTGGTTPTINSTKYINPIGIDPDSDDDETFNAVSICGYNASETSQIEVVYYNPKHSITVSNGSKEVRYTTDGTVANNASAVYDGSLIDVTVYQNLSFWSNDSIASVITTDVSGSTVDSGATDE